MKTIESFFCERRPSDGGDPLSGFTTHRSIPAPTFGLPRAFVLDAPTPGQDFGRSFDEPHRRRSRFRHFDENRHPYV